MANSYPPSTFWKKHKEAGFFQSEKEIFKQVTEKLGLLQRTGHDYCWARHPLAFLTEAADDICYRIVDLEDSFNQKLIRESDFMEILRGILPSEDIDRIDREPESEKIEVIRALSIREAIKKAVEAFQNNYTGIMQGTFDRDLIGVTDLSPAFLAIEDLQKKKVYSNDRVLKIEVAGFSVIAGLLNHFVDAANYFTGFSSSKTSKVFNQKIIDLVPKQFFSDGNAPSADPYVRLLEMTDFISGMTDSYALNLFRSLTGIHFLNRSESDSDISVFPANVFQDYYRPIQALFAKSSALQSHSNRRSQIRSYINQVGTEESVLVDLSLALRHYRVLPSG